MNALIEVFYITSLCIIYFYESNGGNNIIIIINRINPKISGK